MPPVDGKVLALAAGEASADRDALELADGKAFID